MEEIEGDEGVVLLEWIWDLDLSSIHSFGPPSSAKNVAASKIAASNIGG